MANAQPGNTQGHDSAKDLPWVLRLQTPFMAMAASLLFLAVLAVMATLHTTTLCATRSNAYEGFALALFILGLGAVFNWISMEILLGTWLPAGFELPVTVGILLSLTIMAGAIRMTSLVLNARRFDAVFVARLLVAGALVLSYAVTSALGFCVLAGAWLP